MYVCVYMHIYLFTNLYICIYTLIGQLSFLIIKLERQGGFDCDQHAAEMLSPLLKPPIKHTLVSPLCLSFQQGEVLHIYIYICIYTYIYICIYICRDFSRGKCSDYSNNIGKQTLRLPPLTHCLSLFLSVYTGMCTAYRVKHTKLVSNWRVFIQYVQSRHSHY